METGQSEGTGNGLKYAAEHAACENYTAGGRAILGHIELKAGETFVREDLECSMLVFILRGSITVSTAGFIDQPVEEGHMLLIPAGDCFYGRAVTDVTVMRSSFNQDMALCNKFALKQLLDYLPAADGREALTVLPIHELLLEELRTALDVMKTGLLCIHYQRVKSEIVFLELQAFYTKEELARLFAPVLAEDSDFKALVLKTFPNVYDAKELMAALDMPATTFNRKFQAAFGMSAGQWIIRKKKEKLFRDIVMTGKSVGELARKYGFTVNYLTAFCRKHFNATPSELRAGKCALPK